MSRKFLTLFEHHKQPLASKEIFMGRMIKCFWIAFLLLAVTISSGAFVYHYIEGFSWLEATLNAIMVMTGLGLVDNLHTDPGRLFTCFYALVTAMVFYAILAIVFAPLVHRFLHAFHLEMEGSKED